MSVIALQATTLTVDRWLKSYLAGAQQGGCACKDSREREAIFAAHVALQFVDGGRLRPPNNIQRDGLVRVAAKASDLKVGEPGIQCIAQGRRPLVPFHRDYDSLTG